MLLRSNEKWDTVKSESMSSLVGKKYDVIVLNTFFDPKELTSSTEINQKEISSRIQPTVDAVDKAGRLLKEGGLLFVYGLPRHLPFYAVHLNETKDGQDSFLFKYWIALEFKTRDLKNIPNTHIGLLMYLKTKSTEHPTPFILNTKTIRNPHKLCSFCGLNVRDWGGKKHLLNKLGTAISDVWNGISEDITTSGRIPTSCLDRIYELTKKDSYEMIVIDQSPAQYLVLDSHSDNSTLTHHPFSKDKILHADSLELMKEYTEKYPEGVFDLVFADPPYNLAKNYNEYADVQNDGEYISWCNKWLELMHKILRPGGSLFVLNIPKWAIYHAAFLNKKMEFRNWFVWDALSSPTGKLMPAHYALIYYTKAGGKATYNYDNLRNIDSRAYCLRSGCIKKRKVHRQDKKEDLTDIWHDVHRIKHKRDRDSHPCQLPIKLMRRVIELTTNPGDWVFDPFGGAGTTAVAARLTNRHFIISDMDEKYVEISERNLQQIKTSPEGTKYISRNTQTRHKPPIAKKVVETAFISICKQKQQVLSKDQLKTVSPELFQKIEKYYPDYQYLMKITRRLMEVDKALPGIYQARLLTE